jgi:hypothetical protein
VVGTYLLLLLHEQCSCRLQPAPLCQCLSLQATVCDRVTHSWLSQAAFTNGGIPALLYGYILAYTGAFLTALAIAELASVIPTVGVSVILIGTYRQHRRPDLP